MKEFNLKKFQQFIESKIINNEFRTTSIPKINLIEALSQFNTPVYKYLKLKDPRILNNTLKLRFGENIYKTKPTSISLDKYLLTMFGFKKCYICNIIQDLENFHIESKKWDKKQVSCKNCSAKHSKLYRAKNPEKRVMWQRNREIAKFNRIPSWANLEKIQEFYKIARKLSKETNIEYTVDHIIPLQGKYVSGLHVENNLQILSNSENSKKWIYHESEEWWKK